MTVKFRNPPINELVIGVYFARDLHPLRAEHIGLFWSNIRPEFPTIQQQPPVAPPISPGAGVTIEFGAPGEMFPMPRFWIESSDGQTLRKFNGTRFSLIGGKKMRAIPTLRLLRNRSTKTLRGSCSFSKAN